MGIELLLATFLTGLLSILPARTAKLAALSFWATRGQRACLHFLGSHVIGDLIWSGSAIRAVIGVSQFGPASPDAHGLLCGFYLVFRWIKALWSHATAHIPIIHHPFRTWFFFDLNNPWAYVFAVPLFNAVFFRLDTATISGDAGPLVSATFLGFLFASGLVVLWTGLAATRPVICRHETLTARLIGGDFSVFVGKYVLSSRSGFHPRSSA